MATTQKGRVRVIAGLTPPGIIDKALEIIDRDGLDAFSMRKLATELGVQVGALYVHIPDRETLLAEVTSLITSDVLPADPADWSTGWQDWLREFALRWRTVLQTHPSAAPLIGSLVSNSAGDFFLVEAMLRCLDGAGFSGADLVATYNTCVGMILGFIIHEFGQPPQNLDRWRERRLAEVSAIDADDMPLLAKHRDAMTGSFGVRWLNGADRPLDDAFSVAVDFVITGLEARRIARQGM